MDGLPYYFCLISKKEAKNGANLGRTYVYDHRSEWISFPAGIELYLTAGYMKGEDFVTKDGVAYWIKKTFIDLDEKFVVLMCTESDQGCDM
jgi:hypothetical protein